MLFLPSKKISLFPEQWKGMEYFNVAWRQMSASQKRLISTVSGTQAREQPLAPEKFSADSFASVTFRATSRSKMSESMLSVQAQKSLYCGCLWLYRVQYWMWPVPCGQLWSTAAVEHSQKTLILSLDGRSCCIGDVPWKLSGCIFSAQIWAHHFWANYRYSVQWQRPVVVQNNDGLSNLFSCWSKVYGKYNQMLGLSVKGNGFQSCLFPWYCVAWKHTANSHEKKGAAWWDDSSTLQANQNTDLNEILILFTKEIVTKHLPWFTCSVAV